MCFILALSSAERHEDWHQPWARLPSLLLFIVDSSSSSCSFPDLGEPNFDENWFQTALFCDGESQHS